MFRLIGVRLHNEANGCATVRPIALFTIHCCLARQPDATRAARVGNWVTKDCPVMQPDAKTQESCPVRQLILYCNITPKLSIYTNWQRERLCTCLKQYTRCSSYDSTLFHFLSMGKADFWNSDMLHIVKSARSSVAWRNEMASNLVRKVLCMSYPRA